MNFPGNKQQPSLILFSTAVVVVVVGFLTTNSYGASQFSPKLGNTTTSYILRITKLQCIEAPYKRTHLNYCKMAKFPNGTVGLNTSVTIPQVLNYFEVTAKLYYKYKTYRPFMIDWSIELCQAERIGKFNPSTALVMKIIEESVPEFYYPCPHGNRTYATFWMFEPSYIPSTLPSGDYRLDIFFRDSTRSIIYAIQMYASMRKQGLIG
uniref:MD-2-related lipid-recognition domain-containing protein n=1 Tax=Anopheles christyi TaxID=43041 RepID=A0A240PK09_9DIPT